MDDIFYLSTKKITVNNIKQIAEQVNVKNTFIPKSSDVLEIDYSEGVTASWFQMRVEEFEEPESVKFLDCNKIRTIFCISHHPKDLKLILPHLKKVLKEYGGWIGNDSEGFQPCFDIEFIDSFEYQTE